MNETNNEKENVLTDYLEGYQQLELEGVENNLRKVRNTMFVVAGLTLISAIILHATNTGATEDLIFNLIVVAIYVGLAFLTRKAPMTAVIIALVLFIAIWILNIALAGAEYIFRGIIVKGLIIFYLVKGIGYAKDAEELRKRINNR